MLMPHAHVQHISKITHYKYLIFIFRNPCILMTLLQVYTLPLVRSVADRWMDVEVTLDM